MPWWSWYLVRLDALIQTSLSVKEKYMLNESKVPMMFLILMLLPNLAAGCVPVDLDDLYAIPGFMTSSTSSIHLLRFTFKLSQCQAHTSSSWIMMSQRALPRDLKTCMHSKWRKKELWVETVSDIHWVSVTAPLRPRKNIVPGQDMSA